MEEINNANHIIADNIVRVVIDKVYIIPKSKKIHDIEIIEKGKIEESEFKKFNDTMTDFITNKFLETDNSVLNFLRLIIGLFDTVIKKYVLYKNLQANDIHFIYKGGNVLRIMMKESLHELPGNISDILNKYYYNEFKKSDADFSIYINPLLHNFEEIFEDITNISYLVLSHIRLIFLLNEEKYFDFYKHNDDLKRDLLLEYFKKLQEFKLEDEETVLVNLLLGEHSSRKDLLIEFEEMKQSQQLQQMGVDVAGLYDIKRLDEMNETGNILLDNMIIEQKKILRGNPSYFYISVNKALKFLKNILFIRFNLVRMKVNFSAMFNKKGIIKQQNIAGELIDVSIVHKTSDGMQEFFNNLDKNIKTFTYEIDAENEFQFKAISIEYSIHDLETVLFVQTVNYPWEDTKYAKRIKRLLFLYLINMLSNNKNLSVKNIKDYIYGFESNCVNPFIGLSTQKEYQTIIPKIIENINKYEKFAIKNKLSIAEFMRQYKNILSKPIENIEDIKNFILLLKENFDIYSKVLYELIFYIENKQGKLDTSQLYDISQFGGRYDYYKKYVKYKTKYLSLKNE